MEAWFAVLKKIVQQDCIEYTTIMSKHRKNIAQYLTNNNYWGLCDHGLRSLDVDLHIDLYLKQTDLIVHDHPARTDGEFGSVEGGGVSRIMKAIEIDLEENQKSNNYQWPHSKTVYAWEWTERERGWGQRPDGISIHVSDAAARDYLNEGIKKEMAVYKGLVPPEYSRPNGTVTPLKVSLALWDELFQLDEGTLSNHRSWRYNSIGDFIEEHPGQVTEVS